MATNFWLAVLSFMLSSPGCQQHRSSTTPHTIQITDDLGRRVTLLATARRIASLSPAHTEILSTLGCGDRIVLRDRLSSFPTSVRSLPATNPFVLAPEHIAGFRPDLVLLSHVDVTRLAILERIGLSVAVLDAKNFPQLFRHLQQIGHLCGATAAADRLIATLKQRMTRIEKQVQGLTRPRVYVETDGTAPLKPWIAGPGSLVDHLLQRAGGRNFAQQLQRPFVQIRAEDVLSHPPDVLLLMNVEQNQRAEIRARLQARPGWSHLAAVRKNRIIDTIHPDLLSRAGPRLMEGLELLAHALHPEAFAP